MQVYAQGPTRLGFGFAVSTGLGAMLVRSTEELGPEPIHIAVANFVHATVEDIAAVSGAPDPAGDGMLGSQCGVIDRGHAHVRPKDVLGNDGRFVAGFLCPLHGATRTAGLVVTEVTMFRHHGRVFLGSGFQF